MQIHEKDQINSHKVPKNANLKDFIDIDRYYQKKPAIFNKFYETNLLDIIDRLPSETQQVQKFNNANKEKVLKKKQQKYNQQQKHEQQTMKKLVTVAFHHQTDRLNQDIEINDYKFSSLLGRGAHSTVRLTKLQSCIIQYATKILWFDKIRKKYFIKQKDLLQMINNQIILLKKLKHSNIIGFKQAIYLKQKQRIFIVLEFCTKGPITKWINMNLTVDDQEWFQMVKGFFYQFVQAIHFMHTHNVAHRDIKPDNLLITQNDILKVIDFNVSLELPSNGKVKITNKFIGTKGYAAPELILNLQKQKQCDAKKIDIWAIGVTLIQLLQRRHPYPVKTLQQLIKLLQDYKQSQSKVKKAYENNKSNQKDKQNEDKQNNSYGFKINKKYPIQIQDLLSKMMRFNNQERILTDQILSHKWLESVVRSKK